MRKVMAALVIAIGLFLSACGEDTDLTMDPNDYSAEKISEDDGDWKSLARSSATGDMILSVDEGEWISHEFGVSLGLSLPFELIKDILQINVGYTLTSASLDLTGFEVPAKAGETIEFYRRTKTSEYLIRFKYTGEADRIKIYESSEYAYVRYNSDMEVLEDTMTGYVRPTPTPILETAPVSAPEPAPTAKPEQIGRRIQVQKKESVPTPTPLPDTMPYSDISVAYNNNLIYFSEPPLIKKDLVFFPVEDVFQILCGGHEWDSSTGTVSGRKGDITISINLYDFSCSINGNRLDIPAELTPFVENGRTYVQLDYIAKGLGLSVDWNHEGKTITLSDPITEPPYIDKTKNVYFLEIYSNLYFEDGTWPYLYNAYEEDVDVELNWRYFFPDVNIDGWKFKYWKVEDNLQPDGLKVHMDSNKRAEAIFQYITPAPIIVP